KPSALLSFGVSRPRVLWRGVFGLLLLGRPPLGRDGLDAMSKPPRSRETVAWSTFSASAICHFMQSEMQSETLIANNWAQNAHLRGDHRIDEIRRVFENDRSLIDVTLSDAC